MNTKIKPIKKFIDPTERENDLSGPKTKNYTEVGSSFIDSLYGKNSSADLHPTDQTFNPTEGMSEQQQITALQQEIKQEQEKEQQEKSGHLKQHRQVQTEVIEAIKERRKIEQQRQQADNSQNQQAEQKKQQARQAPLEEPRVKVRRSIFAIGKRKK